VGKNAQSYYIKRCHLSSELASFYESTRQSDERSYATYLISGEPVPNPKNALNETEEAMDVDGDNKAQQPEEEEDDDDEGDAVPQLKMTLAGEQDLEGTLPCNSACFP
jgi:hypothetical protein